MSMIAVAKVSRLVGVDQLHIGTAIGKLEAPPEEVVELRRILAEGKNAEGRGLLGQDWMGVKPVFPVSSGGLHPGLIPEIIKMLGTDIIIQVGGGVWGHPGGGRAGAAAVRQAIDAAMEGVDLEEYAEGAPELRAALDTWGKIRPR
jgi:ribulose-bisphosphate carboxylase large chain